MCVVTGRLCALLLAFGAVTGARVIWGAQLKFVICRRSIEIQHSGLSHEFHLTLTYTVGSREALPCPWRTMQSVDRRIGRLVPRLDLRAHVSQHKNQFHATEDRDRASEREQQ
eukprot:2397607-Rhodomonas_salina.3